MLRISLAACVFAASFAMPALAQNTMSGPMANPPPAPGGSPSAATPANDASSMTCDQMMTKAQSMSSSSGAHMTMAQREISSAQMAQAKNDDAGCKMHAAKALNVLREP
jgi:hypothetical protein